MTDEMNDATNSAAGAGGTADRAGSVTQVDAAEADRLARAGAVLLDVRKPDEWAAGHLPDAIHMPLGALDPTAVPSDRVVVVVCRSGNRSNRAAATLGAAGVDVRNLDGGMKAWAAAGRSVVSGNGTAGTVI